MSELLAKKDLIHLVAMWIGAGRRVAGPQCVNAGDPHRQADFIHYAWLTKADGLAAGRFHPSRRTRSRNSSFPEHEILYGYRFKGKQIELVPAELPTTEQIIVGARPCDAAALEILDAVFNWDVKDEFYNRRRELTTVVTLACKEHDDSCFCTSVGSGPCDERGSDVLLVPIGRRQLRSPLPDGKGQTTVCRRDDCVVRKGGRAARSARAVRSRSVGRVFGRRLRPAGVARS